MVSSSKKRLLFAAVSLVAVASPAIAAKPVARSLPPADAALNARDFYSYQLGPSDLVSIEVFGAPGLTREGEVDAAGNLSIPLIGTVPAGGKTPDQVAAYIADKLRGRYLNDPQVSVTIKKAASQVVTVDGSVREPGSYPIVRRMSLQQAIAAAKGADDLANLDHVAIFRETNGVKNFALFSLKKIRAGKMPDPQVFANDIVIVGENGTRRFLKDLNNIPLLGTFTRFIP